MKKQVEMILKAVELDEVNYDQWDFDHINGEEHIVHDVKIEGDDHIQVAYPQLDELVQLKEALNEEKLYADDEELDEFGHSQHYYELLDEVEAWYEGGVNDIFDYDAESIILVNGQQQ